MNRVRRWQLFVKANKGAILKFCCGSLHDSACNPQLDFLNNRSTDVVRSFCWRSPTLSISPQVGDLSAGMNLASRVLRRLKPSSAIEGSPTCLKLGGPSVSRIFEHTSANDNSLSREFFVQLWVADRKRLSAIKKRLQRMNSTSKKCPYNPDEPDLKQPPPSQSVYGFLDPDSETEARIAPLLARSNLLITRDIEWANLVLGFEQENRYAVMDVCYPQSPAGFIREQSNVIARQLLRTRHPFVAYITDAMGNELFRVRRPFWWITSSIYAEVDGQEIGVVHRRWHLWRRIYDLYLGNQQFAVVENPGFWNWTFTLKDANGEVMAQIDRDWRGFGFEIFTDAGQYVIRFGRSDPSSKLGQAHVIQDLEVVRPLSLLERAVAVALAISLDNDYFSRHGGWGIPFIAVEG